MIDLWAGFFKCHGIGVIKREFLIKYPLSLYVPGCPVHPLTFISGVMDWLGAAG